MMKKIKKILNKRLSVPTFLVLLAHTFFVCAGVSEVLQECVMPGCVVFDVGANIGNKTQTYLECQAQLVVCFEPQQNCLETLQQRFGNNPCVHIESCALGKEVGEVDFFVCDRADTISTCSLEWTQDSRFSRLGYRWRTANKVPMSTLDIMIEKYGCPYFCKIDVENGELEVLQGLHMRIPYISFEHHSETIEKTMQCLYLLRDRGYEKYNFSQAESGTFTFDHWITYQELLQFLQDNSHDGEASKNYTFWGDVYARG